LRGVTMVSASFYGQRRRCGHQLSISCYFFQMIGDFGAQNGKVAAMIQAFRIERSDDTLVIPCAVITTQRDHPPRFWLRPGAGSEDQNIAYSLG
jgi:hypothetical protein